MQSRINRQQEKFFIEISIVDQLKALFNRKGFYNDLQYRLTVKMLKNIQWNYLSEVNEAQEISFLSRQYFIYLEH